MVSVNWRKCLFCGGCVGLCPVNAITMYETRIVITDACIDCGICVKFCPVGALEGNHEG
jgi:formate hydrogenlyase subunit 6/NADH:ubiquinone oxidoreductase subunit I